MDITTRKDYYNTPFTELHFTIDMVDFYIRKYPVRTFLSYEDEREDYSGGYDILDIWTAPTMIAVKKHHHDFNPTFEVKKLCDKLKVGITKKQLKKIRKSYNKIGENNV